MKFEIIMQWRDSSGLHTQPVGEYRTMKRANTRCNDLNKLTPDRYYWVQRKTK